MGRLTLVLTISTCLWLQPSVAGNVAVMISDLGDNVKVDQLSMVGAHNASTALDYGWVYGQQKSKVDKQFAAGARFFKIPLHWYDPHKGVLGTLKKGLDFISRKQNDDPYIALCHEYPGRNNCKLSIIQRGGKSPQEAKGILQALAKLATQNPNELIILKLEQYLTHNSKDNGTENNKLSDNIKALDDLLKATGVAKRAYKLNNGWPTLGELRYSGKNIIIFVDDTKFSSNSTYLNYFNNYVNQTDWRSEGLASCKMDKFKDTNTFTEIGLNEEASIPSNSIEGKILGLVNRVKDTGVVKTSNYKKINGREYVMKRIETCMQAHPTVYPNILSSDYIEIGDLGQVASEINTKLLEPKG